MIGPSDYNSEAEVESLREQLRDAQAYAGGAKTLEQQRNLANERTETAEAERDRLAEALRGVEEAETIRHAVRIAREVLASLEDKP